MSRHRTGRGFVSLQTSQGPIPARVRCSSAHPSTKCRHLISGQASEIARGRGGKGRGPTGSGRGRPPTTTSCVGWRGRIRTFDLLIQRTPDGFADGRCDLSVARTRISVDPAGNQVEHAGRSQVNVIRSSNSGIDRIALDDGWEGERFPLFPLLLLAVCPRTIRMPSREITHWDDHVASRQTIAGASRT